MNKTIYSSFSSELMIEMTERFYASKITSSGSKKIYRYLLNGLCFHAKKSIEKIEGTDVISYFSYLKTVRHNNEETIRNKYLKMKSYFVFLDSLAAEYKRQPNHYIQLLDGVDAFAEDAVVKDENVASIGAIKHLIHYLDDSGDKQLRLAVEFAVRYGMTSARIVALKKSDLIQNKGYYCITPMRTPGNNMAKDIALRDDTVKRLVDLCHDISDDSSIFRSMRGGGALSQRRLQQQLSNACVSAELPTITFNSLRNACISFLLAEGAKPSDIEKMTGSPAAMMFRYNEHAGKIADAAVRYHGIPLSEKNSAG